MAQKSPVATIAALRALLFHDDDDMLFVSGTGDRYRYEASSVAVDEGNMAVRPTNFVAAGVWLKVTTDPEEHGAGVVEVTISTAELLALFTTAIEIVPTPGAGKAIIPTLIELFLDYATTDYDGVAAGEDLSVKFTDKTGDEIAQVEATGFLDASADAKRVKTMPEALLTPVFNAPLVLHMLVGNIATGDSPLKVRTHYKVIDEQT